MPWALLYGISGYLFNHPTHFADSNILGLDSSITRDTELATSPDANWTANAIVVALNERFKFETPLRLSKTSAAKYEGEFFIASAEAPGKTIQLLLYRDGSGGTMRTQLKPPASPATEPAPFSVTLAAPQRADNAAPGSGTDSALVKIHLDPKTMPLRIENGIEAKCHEALIPIAERLKLEVSGGDFQITTAPETVFSIEHGNKTWMVRHNGATGKLSAAAVGAMPVEQSWRRFLTRMHVAHGYPIENNARWMWAIVVDVMSFTMILWGVSGIIMWWQIKRTRPLGTVALTISVSIAILLGLGMAQSMR